MSGIRDAAVALEIVDIDGDGKIGLLDFIHFAARLQLLFQVKLFLIFVKKFLLKVKINNFFLY